MRAVRQTDIGELLSQVHITQSVPDAVVGQHRPQVPVSYQVLLAGQMPTKFAEVISATAGEVVVCACAEAKRKQKRYEGNIPVVMRRICAMMSRGF